MRRVVVVIAAGIAAVFASDGGAATGTYSAKPPMIGNEAVTPKVVAFDGIGNRYVAGTFSGVADFDPGKGVRVRTARGPGPEPFVTKFDADGAWVWTQTFGGTGNDDVAAIEFSGFVVYVAGSFDSDDAGFGASGTIRAHHGVANGAAGYVIALDAATGEPHAAFNGTGALTFGGDGVAGDGRAVATSLAASGDALFVGGSFASDGFGIGGSGPLNSTGGYDGFVAAVDSETGAAKSAFGSGGVQSIGGNGDEFVRGLAASNGKLFVGGDTSSTNFGIGGTGAVSTGHLYNTDAFVAAIDATTGAASTGFGGDGVVTFGGPTGTERGAGVSAADGFVYLAGDMDAPDAKVDGIGPPAPLIGGRDLFVLALDAATGTRRASFAGGLQVFGPVQDHGAATAVVAKPSVVYLAGSLGLAGAGIGDPGAAEKADAFVAAFDPTSGGAFFGFGKDGVQTVNGALVDGDHVNAQILGMATFTQNLALVGSVPRGATLGATQFPDGGGYLASVSATTGDPLNMNVNRSPAFTAPPIATPNPAVRGRPVRFTTFVADSDGDRLALLWEFGDGTFTGARSPKTKYAAPGTYPVQVTVDDSRGGQTRSAVLNLVVLPQGMPYFDVTKTTVALKFASRGGDAITVTGQIPLPDGALLAGKLFDVDVGGVSQSFTLRGNGRSLPGDGSVAVSRPKSNVAKFAVTLKRGDFAAQFVDEGMTNATVAGLYTPVVVTVTFYGATYSETVPLFYAAKRLKSGAAK